MTTRKHFIHLPKNRTHWIWGIMIFLCLKKNPAITFGKGCMLSQFSAHSTPLPLWFQPWLCLYILYVLILLHMPQRSDTDAYMHTWYRKVNIYIYIYIFMCVCLCASTADLPAILLVNLQASFRFTWCPLIHNPPFLCTCTRAWNAAK